MPAPPSPTAAERFATLARIVSETVANRTGWALTLTLIAAIIARIRGIKWRIADLAERIGAGKFTPRRAAAAPRTRPGRRPPNNPLPNRFGWLRPMIAETPQFAGMLDALLHDPEMVALMAAAPAAMRRPVRSFCWMLGVRPPSILALKPRPEPQPAEPPSSSASKTPPHPRTRLGFFRRPPPPPSVAGEPAPCRQKSG